MVLFLLPVILWMPQDPHLTSEPNHLLGCEFNKKPPRMRCASKRRVCLVGWDSPKKCRKWWNWSAVGYTFASFACVLTPKVFCSNVLLLACENADVNDWTLCDVWVVRQWPKSDVYIVAGRVDQRYLLVHGYLFPIRKRRRREEALNGEGRTGGGKMEWSCRKKKRRAMRSGHNGQMNAFLFFMRWRL